MRYYAPQSENGVALITALLITAMVSVIAVAMASRQQLDIRRTANIIDGDRAYVFALGVESLSKQVLARDRQDNQTDDLSEKWAMGELLPPQAVEGATVTGRIEDMQGRFNLNNLIKGGNPSALDIGRFRRLLKAAGLDPGLAEAVVDWMDADSNPRFPNGAEDSTYMAMDPPYRAANQKMHTPSELLQVKGFDVEDYAKLAPLVSTLPQHTPINVNTAKAEVLMAVAENMSHSEAQAIAEELQEEGYDSVGAFQQRLQGYNFPADGLSVASDYFLASSTTWFGRSNVQLYSLLERNQDGDVKVVMRAQGTY